MRSIVSWSVGLALCSVTWPAVPHAASPAAQRADSLYQAQDWRAAAAAYEKLVATAPGDATAWFRLATSLYSLGEHARAAAAFGRAARAGIPPQVARYNQACSQALAGDRDGAFATLDTLLEAGFGNVAGLETDTDFSTLRSDARFAGVLERARRNATPCRFAPESRQFDFWIGEWDVSDRLNPGRRVGTSSVQLILGDCVVFENWVSVLGGTGKSFNVYKKDTGRWQQSWVDDKGGVIDFFDGRLENGAMQFQAVTRGRDGKERRRRLTFYDLGRDRVRQFSEASTDGGATWQVEYDFLYERRK